MKYKLFEEYNDNQQDDSHPGFLKSKNDILDWLRENDSHFDYNYSKTIYQLVLREDFYYNVNINGDCVIGKKNIEHIRVKFNYVGGYFDCSSNSLKSLKGCPVNVGSTFKCSDNKLITLQHSPEYIGRTHSSSRFDCRGNSDLVTLGHQTTIKRMNRGEGFQHDELQGSIEQRVSQYVNYLKRINLVERKSNYFWLREVDISFWENVVNYITQNNIDLPGIDVSLHNDALKHNDSGLF